MLSKENSLNGCHRKTIIDCLRKTVIDCLRKTVIDCHRKIVLMVIVVIHDYQILICKKELLGLKRAHSPLGIPNVC